MNKKVNENKKLREWNIKHFKSKEGMHAIIYSSPVHFIQEGKKQEIENELIIDEEEQVYRNKNNPFRVKFSKDLNSDKIVEISKEKYKIEIKTGDQDQSKGSKKSQNINKNAFAEISNRQERKNIVKKKIDSFRKEQKESCLRYQDATDNTDIEYQVISQSLKENIIIKELSDSYNFSFTLKLTSLKAKLQDDKKTINLIDDDTEEVVFIIPSPYMYDKEGEESKDIEVELKDYGNGEVIYSLYPNEKWINDEERVIPITIDPSIVTKNSEYIEINNASSAGSSTEVRIRNSVISKAFDKNIIIKNATLQLTPNHMASDTSKKGYEVYINEVIVDRFITKGADEKICINLTTELEEAIKNEANRESEYIDIRIRPATGNEGYITFYTSTAEEEKRPIIMVDYVSSWSKIDEKSYQAFNCKGAGTGRINLTDGNLEFDHYDVQANSSILPLQIYHNFNNRADGEQFAFSLKNNVKTRLTSGFEDMKDGRKGFGDGIKNYYMGKGWKLNIQQQLIKHIDEESVTPDDRLITYIDGEGNRHSFIERYYYYSDFTKGKKRYIKNEDVILTNEGNLVYKTNSQNNTQAVYELTPVYNSSGLTGYCYEIEGRVYHIAVDDENIIEDYYGEKLYQIPYTSYYELTYPVYYEMVEEETGLVLDTLKSKICYLSESDYSYEDKYYLIANDKKYYFKKDYMGNLWMTIYSYQKNQETYYVLLEETEYEVTGDKRYYVVDDVKYETTKETFEIEKNQILHQKCYFGGIYQKVQKERIYKDNTSTKEDIILKIDQSFSNDQIETLEEVKVELLNQKSELENTYETYKKEYENNELNEALKEAQNSYYQLSKEINEFQMEYEKSYLLNQQEMIKENLFCTEELIENKTISMEWDKGITEAIQPKDLTKYSYKTYKNKISDWSNDEIQDYQLLLSKANDNNTLKQLEYQIKLLEKNKRLNYYQTLISQIQRAKNEEDEEERKNILNENLVYIKSQIELIDKNLKIIEKELNKLRLEEKKKANDYITTPNNEKLGFDYYGRLVCYQNNKGYSCSIVYENDKIIKVIDAEENEFNFNYYEEDENIDNSGLLKSIIDNQSRVTTYEYKEMQLVRIVYPDITNSTYEYDSNKLKKIINSSGYGIELNYENGKIIKYQEIAMNKSIYDDEIVSSDSLIDGEYLNISYNKLTTTISDKYGNEQHYIFDNQGNTISIHTSSENEDGLIDLSLSHCEGVYTVGKTVLDEKYSLGAGLNKNSENLYLGGDVSLTGNAYNEVISSKDITIDEVDLKEFYLFSAFAKSENSLFIPGRKSYIDKEDFDNINITSFDDMKKNRRFGLYVEVEYATDESNPGIFVDTFYSPYDYQNKDLQFNAVPVHLRKDKNNKLINPIRISVGLDYSFNEGSVSFTQIKFSQCEYEYVVYNDNETIKRVVNYNSVSKYEYNEDKLPIKITTIDKKGNENIFTLEYNSKKLLVRLENGKGMITENIYDKNHKLLRSVTYQKEEPTSRFYQDTTYDAFGRLEKEYDARGGVDGEDISTKYEYYPTSNLIKSVTDPNQNKKVYGYDKNTDLLINISQSTLGLDNQNIMKYKVGYLTKLIHNDFEYGFRYDGFGRISNIEIEEQEYLSYSYNENVINKTLANGDSFVTTYDNQGRISKVALNDVEIINNTYDEKDNLINSTRIETDGTKKQYSYTYDALGRIKTKTTNNLEEENIYDEYDNLQSKKYVAKAKNIEEQFLYNSKENSLTNLKYIVNNEEKINEEIIYDKQERLSKVKINNNYEKQYDYLKIDDHATHIIQGIRYFENGKTSRRYAYRYDNNGNIKEVIKDGDLVTRYKYDSINRVVREDNKELNITTIYEYDKGGNILSRKRGDFTLDNNPLLTDVKEYKYKSTGWKDQLISYDNKEITYDEMGNPTKYKDNTLIWERGRLLVQYGSNKYTYNSEGIRTSKEVNREKTEYILSGNRIISEIKGTTRIDYLYDIEGVIGFIKDNTTYIYKKNIQGDVVSISTIDGVEKVCYSYDVYGNCEITKDTDGIGSINPFRYRSYYFDEETQLFYCNSRYYSPELCRWISPDSIEYLDPQSINGLNLYCYCYNNPISYSDPSGNLPFFILTAIIGAVIGVGITAAVDYIPDKEFDLHWGWYVGAGVLGAAIGAGIGMAVSYYATGSIASSTGKVFSGLFGKTTLYRSVGPDELADIQETGRFNLGNGSMEAKQFGLSLDETKAFGNWVNQSNIVSTKIPNRIFYRLDHTMVDVGIFKSGVVTVQSSMLNTFNNSLLGIMFL